MSNKKITRYNIDRLDAENADISLAFGERSNGKSYQVKHKKAVIPYIESSIENKERFVLIRRWKDEITTDKIERYFADVDVPALTDNKYNCIIAYRKQLFFATYDINTGKTKRGEKIGYYMALSTEQNYAGGSYLDVTNMIFEEFMSRSEYIHDEPDKLMNLYSTIDRKRHKVRLWLVGNTITRVCPYLTEWGLLKDISSLKQGDIITKKISTGTFDENGKEIFVKIAIEHCASTGESSFAIGKHKAMLNKGEWQSDPQPHLPKSLKEYKSLFRFMFVYQGFKFCCKLLEDLATSDICWFIQPYKGAIDNNTIVFSDIIKVSPLWQRDIYNTDFVNNKINDLFKTFRESKIFYASDLCGTEFKQAIDFTIKK